MEWFTNIHPILQGLLATMFTYIVTALGASSVLFFKSLNQKILDLLMGFAGGVMLAASFWSLLQPAILLSEKLGKIPFLWPSIGFFCGGIFIILSDRLIQRTTKLDDSSKRGLLLTSAVTLHNIPEGLAVGVAFGTLALGIPGIFLIDAILIAFGIGMQNFPEGACVAMPLRRDGMSRKKAFLIGQSSGLVEPIAGVIGVIFALMIQNILPFLLSFSAGAMICVVCAELVPDSIKGHKILASIGILIGFIIMMILDVALG